MAIETVRKTLGARTQMARVPASALGRLGTAQRGQGPAGPRKRVRVLIADDHAVVLRGLRSLLESQPDIEICGEATNGLDVVEKDQALSPEMVILDIGMPELNGLEATRAIRLKHPNVEILVLTMHFSEQVARQILKAGARGYLLKTDSDAQLLAAISSLRQHKPFLTSRVADVVLTGFVEGDVAETIKRAVAADFPYGPLSRRERQVMQLLAEGYSNKEVAARLSVSPRTVETHRNHVMHKLRLNSFSELVRYAVRNNIVEA